MHALLVLGMPLNALVRDPICASGQAGHMVRVALSDLAAACLQLRSHLHMSPGDKLAPFPWCGYSSCLG